MPLPDFRLCCAIHEPCGQPWPLPPPHATQQLHEAQKHFSAAHSHCHYVTKRELDDDTRVAASTRAPATSSSPMTHRCPPPPQLGLRAPDGRVREGAPVAAKCSFLAWREHNLHLPE